jgi:histidyl-tRNA synthetase
MFKFLVHSSAVLGVHFVPNDRLVRGLDYCTRNAFEFTHGALGARNVILGGGQRDSAVFAPSLS